MGGAWPWVWDCALPFDVLRMTFTICFFVVTNRISVFSVEKAQPSAQKAFNMTPTHHHPDSVSFCFTYFEHLKSQSEANMKVEVVF